MRALRELLDLHALPDSSGGKDTNGTVLIIGGPPSCPGATMLAGIAALRLGSGRVQLVVHPEVAAATGTAVPETKVLAWDQASTPPADVRSAIGVADVVIVGSGHADMDDGVVAAIAASVDDAFLVLDAGALRAMKASPASATASCWHRTPTRRVG